MSKRAAGKETGDTGPLWPHTARLPPTLGGQGPRQLKPDSPLRSLATLAVKDLGRGGPTRRRGPLAPGGIPPPGRRAPMPRQDLTYLFRRWCRIRFRSFLYLCLAIFLRRFLTTLPMTSPLSTEPKDLTTKAPRHHRTFPSGIPASWTGDKFPASSTGLARIPFPLAADYLCAWSRPWRDWWWNRIFPAELGPRSLTRPRGPRGEARPRPPPAGSGTFPIGTAASGNSTPRFSRPWQ